MKDNPILQSLETRLTFVDCYLADLKLQFPEEAKDHKLGFSSMDTLLSPPDALLHVAIVFKMELEYQRQRRVTGEYAPDYLEWLCVLKHATRAAVHLTDTLMDEYPDDLNGFAYRSPARNEVQKTWSILMFASLELTKSIMAIEDCYPELQDQFSEERIASAALWHQQQVMFQEQERWSSSASQTIQ
jgi:hypothetical protein